MYAIQPTITQKFKNKKKSLNELPKQRGQKRKLPDEENENELAFQSNLLNSKRIKIDESPSLLIQKPSLQSPKGHQDLASKSTVCSITDSPNKESVNKFDLSSKTKNIIYEILQKKKRNTNKPNMSLIQSKILLNNEDNSVRFSVGNSIEGSSKKKKKESIKEKEIEKKSIVKPPVLSDKAKAIIEKLKEERKNRFERDDNKERQLSRSESAFSLRFKYEELLKRYRELPLPTSYKALFNSFVALDQTINLNKIKAFQQVPTFDYLKSSIESSTHRKFSLKTFQQILYIVPHFFIYKYEKYTSEESNNVDYNLIIDIPSNYNILLNTIFPCDFNFTTIQYQKDNFKAISNPISQSDANERKKVFKNVLYELVNKYHKKFLEENNLRKFNPLKAKTWHHTFDLETMCEEIPIFTLEPKPTNTQIFERVIAENDIKSMIMKDAMSSSDGMDIEGEQPKKEESELNKYVSFEFIKKLKAKEEANKVSKEIIDYNYHLHSQMNYKEIHMEIVKQIKTYFCVNSCESLEISQMAEVLLNSGKEIKAALYNKENVIEVMKKISKAYPKILQIKKNSIVGYVVIMDMKAKIPKEIIIE